ncbi:MAG: GSCFA domain-containing protein, partial [Flavobacteriales bacterium]|nr:GSCFA domain-containing protein [Flavobacteriales bacterium]
MKFRTEIKLDKGEDSIALTDKVVFLGSCFALQIGAAFERYKFGTTVNPDGIIYNPKSILQSIDRAMRKDLSAASAIFRENDQWHSFDHHSSLSADNAEALKENIQEAN